jgi:hypothetical protein
MFCEDLYGFNQIYMDCINLYVFIWNWIDLYGPGVILYGFGLIFINLLLLLYYFYVVS